jgi:hypothetical protein
VARSDWLPPAGSGHERRRTQQRHGPGRAKVGVEGSNPFARSKIFLIVNELVFIREDGFPRRWSAVRRTGRDRIGIITQEHERNGHGKSVFRYRAALLPHKDLGLFTTLRHAKRAVTEALAA